MKTIIILVSWICLWMAVGLLMELLGIKNHSAYSFAGAVLSLVLWLALDLTGGTRSTKHNKRSMPVAKPTGTRAS